MSKKLFATLRIVFALAMVFSLAIPVFQAQDTQENVNTVVLLGPIEYDGETVLVDGWVVVPPEGFNAEDFPAGEKVAVVGELVGAGEDAQVIAWSLELWNADEDDECDPEVDEDCDLEDDECDPEVDEDCDLEDDECDPEVDEDCDLEDDDEDEEEDSRGYACERDDHPAGEKLSDSFEVEYDEVMTLFCDGYGFGEIGIAYKLADGDEELLEEILAMREDGMGWGLIRKEFAEEGEEDVIKAKGPKWERQQEVREERGRGNGKDKDKENRGRGNDKDKDNNGRGNSGNNGRGNSGNNGNGNGNGN